VPDFRTLAAVCTGGPDRAVALVDHEIAVILNGEPCTRMAIGRRCPERGIRVVENEVSVGLHHGGSGVAVLGVRRPGRDTVVIEDEVSVMLLGEHVVPVAGRDFFPGRQRLAARHHAALRERAVLYEGGSNVGVGAMHRGEQQTEDDDAHAPDTLEASKRSNNVSSNASRVRCYVQRVPEHGGRKSPAHDSSEYTSFPRVPLEELSWLWITDFYDRPLSGMLLYEGRICWYEVCDKAYEAGNLYRYAIRQLTPADLEKEEPWRAVFIEHAGKQAFYDAYGEDGEAHEYPDRPIIGWFEM
jgi:hypothetical protein